MHKNPFILGLEHTLIDSALCTTEALYERVGHNTGNLAFHHAIHHQLAIKSPPVSWGESLEKIGTAGDVAILPCANQIGAHLDYGGLSTKFNQIIQPMVAIGLGAQGGLDGKIPEVPKGSQDWLRAIAEHSSSSAPNIAVRGPFTMQVLEHYGLADKAVVLGCPTLFINPDPQLGQKIAQRIREPKKIAVAAGHQRWIHLGKIEASLARMASATDGSYVGQSPLEMVKLARGEGDQLDEETIKACRDYAMPELNIPEFIVWSKRYGNVFFDIPSWMEHYRRFDLVIGARIHGVMLALQAGIPGICIAHDSRTLELCQVMKVPYVLSRDVMAGVSRKDLLGLFKFDPLEFDQNREKLGLRYKKFLTENSIFISEGFVESQVNIS